MGKVKVKKQNTFIDMTAMSDVTVLLLTFFMLTATFLPKEPVQVLTPASVSEVKVPEYNALTILIDKEGKVFLSLDRDDNKSEALKLMAKDYNITLNDKEMKSFIAQTHIGVPMGEMKKFLNKPLSDQDAEIKKMGVPTDSINNQLAHWVRNIRTVNEDITIAIKADEATPYPFVDRVMKTLVDIKENRYNLVTTLRGMPEGI